MMRQDQCAPCQVEEQEVQARTVRGERRYEEEREERKSDKRVYCVFQG